MRFQHYINLLLCSFAPQKKCRGDLNGMISKTLVKGQIDQLSLPLSLSLCIAIPKVKLRVTNFISGNPLKIGCFQAAIDDIYRIFPGFQLFYLWGCYRFQPSIIPAKSHPSWGDLGPEKFPEIKNRALVLKCSLCLFKTATETI